MEPGEGPLRVTDPRLLGPFQVRARLAEREAGVVFLGADGTGAPVAIAVLGAAAANDPAVRERFAAESARLDLLDSAPNAPLGWAAVRHDPGASVGPLLDLLAAAALTSPDAPGAGPAFAPHWSGGPDRGLVPPPFHPPPEAPRGMPVPAIVGVTVVGVVALFLLGVFAARSIVSGGGPVALPTAPSSPPSPSPTPAKDGPPGPVAGPTYGEGEKKYRMKLGGFPFAFDAPGTWGCMRSDRKPYDSRWICRDEGGTFPPTGRGAGGMVAVRRCPGPCDEKQRRTLRKDIAVDDEDWKRIDDTTMYAEVEGELDGEQAIRVAMSHVFPSKRGGKPDTAVDVQLTGPPDERKTMQKLVNEIRARAS